MTDQINFNPKPVVLARRKSRRKIWFLVIVLFLILIAAGTGGFFINRAIREPLSSDNQEKIFSVEKGQGAWEIANNLSRAQLIRHPWLFVGYLWYRNLNRNIQVGKYSLRPNMTIPEIADILSQGKIKEIKITFPEGFSIEQMAQRLEEHHLVSANDFKKATKKYYPYRFLDDRPKNQDLQGFLFPDTYNFTLDTTADEIVEKMLLNFDRHLDNKLRDDIKKTNMNIYEIVTMASIVEKEASGPLDQKIVAGIFYRRWNSGKPLQSCATLAYILKSNKRRFSYADTQVKSPYNTYLHKGLPPGPICNPGLSAIKAAIYPQKTDYLYFLSTKEGKTIYAKTYEEQLANEKKYLE